jgi:hypothetical protein
MVLSWSIIANMHTDGGLYKCIGLKSTVEIALTVASEKPTCRD